MNKDGTKRRIKSPEKPVNTRIYEPLLNKYNIKIFVEKRVLFY